MLKIAQSMLLKKPLITECGRTVRIGIPIVIAQLLNISMGFVDTVMTGNYSAEALAAVSGSQHLIMPLIMFIAAVISAGQAITAQYVGAGRKKQEIGKVTAHGLLIGLCFAVLLFIYTKIAPLFLPFFGFDVQVIALAEYYLKAFAWGLPGTIFFITFTCFYAGISRPMMTMIVSFIMLAMNVIGNYTLIYGHFGFPELGVVGAGWASTLSAWSGALTILMFTFLRREFREHFLGRPVFRLYSSLLRQILKIGLPSGLSIIFESSMFAVFSLLMGRFGVTVLAGSQIALNCAAIMFMIPLGLSFAITTNVAVYVGQEKYREARLAGIAGYTVSICFSILSATALFLFNHQIAAVYTNNPELITIAATLLVFAGIFQLSDGLQVSGIGILRGYKDTRIPMISNLVSYWGVGMTLGYILGFVFDFEAQGMWVGIIIGLSVAAILHGLRFRSVASHWIQRQTDITD
ncbi:MAG: MATE family efflux transporter [Deltaproteobacteria bacterium]|nr:MATE family efflux transporter [Deltaproteobacteria bacterium]MBT4638096.1 MATE family efflux transporter [Deltaproteobacteria bacterium]MBT6500006.1 MATE family efflux transporter [Deltaproteobacteria bacterium]MBT6613033.1 MATE family efflux transporter [Deltaproteobacteria bacterium]MBT7154753.1 MATE family efflux transporter [Deltaproteobacteria bacterium]